MRFTENIIYVVVIGLVISCNNSKSQPGNQQSLKNLTCENEKELLINQKSNWKIPVERINNIENYITESDIQLKLPIANDGIEITKYGVSLYSNIYPYTNVEGINIGLLPLVRHTGSGHFSKSGDSFKIVISEEQKTDLNIRQDVFAYYQDFEPKSSSNSSTRLVSPRIDLTFAGNSFRKINDVLAEISIGYLEAAELHSQKKYSNEICQLDDIQLETLKSEFKLNIRIYQIGRTK